MMTFIEISKRTRKHNNSDKASIRGEVVRKLELYGQPNESWIAGTYTVDNHKITIDTSYRTIAIDGYRTDFFAQGDSAEQIIDELHYTWIKSGKTDSEVVTDWYRSNF